MHLWPRGRRNLGPLQSVPPVERTGHPHRLEPDPHHRTARQMADAVPGDPTTHHRPQADRGTRGGQQGTRPHCRLHLATHPREGPPGHGGAHAADGRCQDSGAAHIPHPQIPAACSNAAPNRPRPPPQTPVLPTMRPYPVTYQHGTPTTPTHHPPSTTLARHTRAPEAAHTRPPACARHQPRSPHATVRRQVPPTASHRMTPLRTPAATTDGPALQPRPLGLSGSRAPPHPLPPLRGPQPSPPRAARGPSRTPPRQPPRHFRPLTDTLRDHLGGYYVGDAADHAWTIAVAKGSTPLPPHSPPLRHSGGGLNVAARHILLALYLHHRDLHLPDPQLPAPQAAVLTPEAWADTAPEEIAAYLRITCRRFNTALGRRKGTPYPLSALLYPAHHPHPTQLKPPEGWASFWDAHLAAPDEATATRMGLTDQRTYVRGLETSLREAHRWHARSPSPPRGQAGSPAPDTHQAKKTKTGQGARQRARQQGATPRPEPGSSHTAPPHAQTPGAHQQHRPRQRPPPPPYRSTQTLQPSQPPPPAYVHTMRVPPWAQSQGTWHHQHHPHTPVPPNPYPLMPPCYSDAHQLHPDHAPAQPGSTNHPPHMAHITAPHHHVFHHHQPLRPHPPTPGYNTQPAHPQHHHQAVQHHPPPPLHGPRTHERQ